MPSAKGYLRVSEKDSPRELSKLEADSEVRLLTSWNILEGLSPGCFHAKGYPTEGVIPGLSASSRCVLTWLFVIPVEGLALDPR